MKERSTRVAMAIELVGDGGLKVSWGSDGGPIDFDDTLITKYGFLS